MPSESEVNQLVQRIVASAGFRKTVRLRDLLVYLSTHQPGPAGSEVTETQIGLDVFHRRSFYPGEDSIVRVTTRQLRSRLDDYFHNEGQNEKLVLEIPRGSYALTVRERETVEPAQAPPPAPPARQSSTRLAIILALVAAASLSSAAWLWLDNRALRAGPPVPHTLVSDLLVAPSQRTILVAADSGYFMLQKLTGHGTTLKEYIDRSYQAQARAELRDPRLQPLLEHLEKANHTGIAELNVFTHIIHQNPRAAIEVRHAKDMTLRSFQADNFLILGSPQANPWCELFEEKMSFRTEFDPRTGKPVIRNRDPRPGEPQVWRWEDQSAHYAHVAVVPNLSSTGSVLLSSAISMPAKEAAGDFINDPSVPALLAKRFGVTNLRELKAFEVVLRSRALDGVPRGWEIVASRRR